MSHKRRKLASGSLVVGFWDSQGFFWQLGSWHSLARKAAACCGCADGGNAVRDTTRAAQRDMEIERSAGGYDHGDGDGQRRRWRWP